MFISLFDIQYFKKDLVMQSPKKCICYGGKMKMEILIFLLLASFKFFEH